MKDVVVKGVIHRDKINSGDIWVYGYRKALETMVKRFRRTHSQEEIPLQIIFRAAYGEFITDEQRGYIFAHLGEMTYDLLTRWGVQCNDVHDALTWIKYHPQVDFTEKVIDHETGEVKKKALSFSNKAQVPRWKINEFINRLIMLLINEGHKPISGSDYWKAKRWKMV